MQVTKEQESYWDNALLIWELALFVKMEDNQKGWTINRIQDFVLFISCYFSN